MILRDLEYSEPSRSSRGFHKSNEIEMKIEWFGLQEGGKREGKMPGSLSDGSLSEF